MSDNIIEIPLKDTDEIIELSRDQLPAIQESLAILKQEHSPLSLWIKLAMEYYTQGKISEFVDILEASRQSATTDYDGSRKDRMMALDSLAAYYARKAYYEKSRETKRSLFTQATLLYTTADQILTYDTHHLLGRAYLCLLEGEKLEQADGHFTFILNQQPSNVQALLGRASISFLRKEYKNALGLYRRALRICPQCPAETRIGIAHCFVRLNQHKKARLAFQRALKLKPDSISALVGVAVLDINDQDSNSVKLGVQRLSEAYSVDAANSIVLNHLAEHFFFRKELQRVKQLALHAFHNTDSESNRSESCYQLARANHCMGEYDQAFQYYYQSTQFAPPNFVLPQYGLGQMYIHRGDIPHAIECFRKVIEVHPDNCEAMRILGSLLAECKQDRITACTYLTKVTEKFPDDLESWIELAQLLEEHEASEALKAYTKVINLFTKLDLEIPCEILNNIACLHLRLSQFEDAIKYYKDAYDTCTKHDNTKAKITINYNLARAYERMSAPSKAEKIYKKIIHQHHSYVDALLRLGCMARQQGQIYEASDWFKDALQVNQDNHDAWSLIGNLHLAKQEWGPAQKKFERVLSKSHNDTYAMIALGNVWLDSLFQPNRDRSKDKRHRDRAISIFRKVLTIDNRNIWATNGIACVLANKGYLNEARDLFAQVREVISDFKDVWLNIAHVYVEKGQNHPAIRMYETCYQKFCKNPDPEILLYLARAYFRAGNYKEALDQLLNARRVAPDDIIIIFNIAVVQQRMTVEVLQNERSDLNSVIEAVRKLETAMRTFKRLSENNEKDERSSREGIMILAEAEARKCSDLMSQAQYHVQRAKLTDEKEKEIRRKQEEQRRIIQEQTEKEEQEKIKQQEITRQELEAKRIEYLNKAKKLLESNAFDIATNNRRSRNKTATKEIEESFLADSEDADFEPPPEKTPKRKRNSDKKNRIKKRKQENKMESALNNSPTSDKCYYSSENDDNLPTQNKRSKKMPANNRFKSKAFITSSEDSDHNEPVEVNATNNPLHTLGRDFVNKPLSFSESNESDFSNAAELSDS